MTTLPHLATEAQVRAAQDAERKLQSILVAVETLRQWSAQANIDHLQLQARAAESQKINDVWRDGAAAGRSVAYARAAQLLEKILQEPAS